MFRIRDEVKSALLDERPVVALETTLVTHGLPAPRGIETARASEAAVRKAGAVPATIGILDGVIVVGLDDGELARLADLGMKGTTKAGARDLAALVTAKGNGSTTVSGTIAVAARAGIRILATGGIGGVHREWVHVPDVSADLFALARTAVAVVSAGFKSILDVPATSEILEAMGVPVIGFGTRKLPGFYTKDTAIPLDHSVPDAAAAAALLRTHWHELGRPEGVLIANPPPANAALPAKEVEPAVAAAVAEATKQGITGKALTPFLLDLVVAKLGDKALDTNSAVIVHDAKVAAEIAVAFTRKLAPTGRVGF